MSFVPVSAPRSLQRLPDVSIATRTARSLTRGYERDQVVFRFSGGFARKIGLTSATRMRAYWDTVTLTLRLSSCVEADAAGRSALRRGGSAIEIRYPHTDLWQSIVPVKCDRVPLRVIQSGPQTCDLDLSPIAPTHKPNPQ